MRAIWKFPLVLTDRQVVRMPEGAQILHVDEQNGQICLWAGITEGKDTEDREIQIIGTGYPELPDEWVTHLGSVVMQSGYVWHVFERDNHEDR